MSDVKTQIVIIIWFFGAFLGVRYGWVWQRNRMDNRSETAVEVIQDLFEQTAYHRTTVLLAKRVDFYTRAVSPDKPTWVQIMYSLNITMLVFFAGLISKGTNGNILVWTLLFFASSVGGGVLFKTINQICREIPTKFGNPMERSSYDYMALPAGLSVSLYILFFIQSYKLFPENFEIFLPIVSALVVIAAIEYIIDTNRY